MNPFGPQGAQAVTSLPSGNSQLRYGTSDTWFKDCTAPGSNDATVLDAATLNNLIGNLAYLVTTSGYTPVARGDMTLLYNAVRRIAQTQAGLTGATISGGTF